MIPDRLQYFLYDFWNDQKCDKIWTLEPLIHHQNTSRIQANIGTPLKYSCSYLRNWNYEFVARSVYIIVWTFVCLLCLLFCFRKRIFAFWNFALWRCEIWKMKFNHWNFETFGILKLRNLNVWNSQSEHSILIDLTIWNFPHWKLTI